MWDDDEWGDGEWPEPRETERPEPEPDPYVERARKALLEVFERRTDEVFYGRQLQVHFEDKFFHWVTSRALEELVDEGAILSAVVPLRLSGKVEVIDAAEAGVEGDENGRKGTKIRFFFSKRKRYWRSRAKEILKLVSAYSKVDFSQAVGRQAEVLFDAAMPKEGFKPVAEETQEYNGRRWVRTGHDLDRIFEFEGAAYGVEVKNQLAYIERPEFEAKIAMCRFLGLRPVFIARMMPKSYIYEVHKNHGGFCLIFKHQLYPFGAGEFAKTVRENLGLPVDCPRGIEAGTVKRLAKRCTRETTLGATRRAPPSAARSFATRRADSRAIENGQI